METLEKALEIALKAHQGQKDKSGKPYILHPLAVMHKATTLEEKIVAVLHDVVEDSDFTLLDLKNAGFSDTIIEAVDLLTKRKGESYQNFIERVAKNKLACKIKIYDITHNLDVTRLSELKNKDLERINKYLKALEYLETY